jgi:hypothetical protein
VDNPDGSVPQPSRTAFQTDGGQLAYHPQRHSGHLQRVSAIAQNAVRDQPGTGVHDQWNAQQTITSPQAYQQ